SNNDITTLYVDDTKVVWAGTSGGGINKFDPFRKQFYHFKDRGGAATIRALYRDANDRVWIGSDGGGIEVSNGPIRLNEQTTFQRFAFPRRVYAMLEIENEVEHAMYLGSNVGPGMFRADLRAPSIRVQPVRGTHGSVFAMIEDRSGAIWIGNYFDGLRRWVPDPGVAGGYVKKAIGKTGENVLPNQIIRSLQEDLAGNIWIGTGDGLAVITAAEARKDDPQIEVYRNIPGDATSISNNYILPICVTKEGVIWVGTFGGGINKFIPAADGQPARFKSYGEADGLIDGVIKAIVEDETGKLWISSNRGLSRFNPRTEVFENFDVNDGLQGDEFGELAACTQADGSFIFGGVNGLTFFYPDAIKLNSRPAR
ncbi:MAG: two-component regulator propeller domain-containing protein, partial [Bacteroidota bacterium]